MTNWKNYNDSLVKRGEVLFSFDVIDNWNTELEKMNNDKECRKFVYPDSFIKLLGYMRAYFHLSYRQTESVVQTHASSTLQSSIQDYSKIYKRIKRLDTNINEDDKSSLHADHFVIQFIRLVLKLQTEGNELDISGMSREVI